MPDEVAEFLDACADDVSQDGHWIQKKIEDGKGGACALGIMSRQALRAQAEVWFPARGFVKEAIGSSLLSRWNDAPERTQGEVADAFRTAAKIAREKAEKNV